jgi:hypothetical protein
MPEQVSLDRDSNRRNFRIHNKMEDLEKRLLQLENDRDCLMKFKNEMTDTFNKREPAKQTWEFIGSMKTDMALNSKDHQELKEGVRDIKEKLDEFIKAAPTKESSWAEKVWIYVAIVAGALIITALFVMLFKDGLIR